MQERNLHSPRERSDGSRILTPYAVLEFSDHIPQLQALVQYDRIAGEGAGKDGKVMEMLLGEKG